jgi:hypothetical protein
MDISIQNILAMIVVKFGKKENNVMLTKKRYEELKNQHEIACQTNDYAKMIMIGSNEYEQMREYESKFCEHNRVEEIQGGQIEKCLDCGKKL